MTSFVGKFIHQTVPAAPHLGVPERLVAAFRVTSERIGAAYATGRAYEDARGRAARQSVLDGYSAALHRHRF
jgi:hypothetical protein